MSAGEIWFDVEAKKRLDVVSFVELPLESLPVIRSLGELLLADEFPFTEGDFEPPQPENFNRKKSKDLGKLALAEMAQVAGEPVPLSMTILERLHLLGLGIKPASYFRRKGLFKSLQDFKIIVGSPPGYTRGRFDNWNFRRVLEAAAEVEAMVGGKPTSRQYNEAAASDYSFPHSKKIIEIVGSVGLLNEHLGYPNVRMWAQVDYVQFGVHLIEKNGMDKFKKDTFDVLSAKKRGPGYSRILSHFDTWAKYKDEVLESLEFKNNKIEKYKQQIVSGELPDEYAGLPEDDLLQRGARFEVMRRLVSDFSFGRLKETANIKIPKLFAESFANKVRYYSDKYVTDADVEAQAEAMGLEEFIWPRQSFYREYITVTDDELKERRRIAATNRSAWEQSKRAA